MMPHSSNSLKFTKARFCCLASCLAMVVLPQIGGPQMTARKILKNTKRRNYDEGHHFQLASGKKQSLLQKLVHPTFFAFTLLMPHPLLFTDLPVTSQFPFFFHLPSEFPPKRHPLAFSL